MSTITKERAEIKAFITGFLTDPAHDNQSSHSMTAEVFRIALASLESEPGVNHQPVAWQYKEYVHVRGLGYLWREKLDCEFPGADCETLQDVVPLYIAPPVPVSVPEWTNEQCLEFLSIAFRHAEIKGDLELDDIRLGVKMVNDSRAAMLNQEKSNG